jgi:ferredoxin-NADP reductase
MSVARWLTERSWPGDIFFVHACRTPADFIFANELTALRRLNPRLHVAVTASRVEDSLWTGHRGRITGAWLAAIVPDLASRRVHLCGPPAMMDATRASLLDLGVSPDQVKTELFGTPKPIPASAGTSAAVTTPATGPLVTFSEHAKTARSRPGQTVLELSEALDIGIEYSCRVGTCGVCKSRMTAGEVEMPVEEALDADEKARGAILACQARPVTDIVVAA